MATVQQVHGVYSAEVSKTVFHLQQQIGGDVGEEFEWRHRRQKKMLDLMRMPCRVQQRIVRFSDAFTFQIKSCDGSRTIW